MIHRYWIYQNHSVDVKDESWRTDSESKSQQYGENSFTELMSNMQL